MNHRPYPRAHHFIFFDLIMASVLALCIINTLVAQNENIVFERINTSNGLSNNSIKEIFQDSKGFLWIGTNDGLNRYDGYNFISYRNDPQDTTSISNNNIWDIYEDKSGVLWISSEDGLNRYNREKDNFTNYRYSNSPGNFANMVLNMYEDNKGNFWVGTVFKGLTKFDRKSEKFKHFAVDSSGRGNANIVMQISEDIKDKNKLWLGKWDAGFGYFNIEKEAYMEFKYDPAITDGLSAERVQALMQDSDGIIWLGTQGGGLNRFDPQTNEYRTFNNDPKNSKSLSNNNVWDIYEAKTDKNILWIATEKGLNKFNKQTHSFTTFKSIINDQNSLSADFVLKIYGDQSGVMWIGTVNGLNKIDPGRIPFKQHNNVEGETDGLNHNSIMGIIKSAANPNLLWIGTYGGGLNILDRDKNKYSYIRKSDNGLKSDSIRSIYEDPDEAGEVLWLGVANGGLQRFNIKNKTFKTYSYSAGNSSTIGSNLVRQEYETRDGMIWLATNSGISKFDRKKDIFTRYTLQDTTYNKVIQNKIVELADQRKPLAAIVKVGEGQDLSRPFELIERTHVFVVSLGEGTDNMWDYGWLEDQDGNVIWKFIYKESMHAGGGSKNRMEVWNGSLNKGKYVLRYISDTGHSFNNWNTAPPINEEMYGIQVFKISENENNIITKNIAKFEKPSSLAGFNTTCIVEDSYGMLWIGTQDGGLNKFDRKTDSFTNYTYGSDSRNSINNNFILSLLEDKNGTLWIGTRGGLNRFDSKTTTFKAYTIKDGLPNNIIVNILEDNNGNLWLATNNGVSKFNPDDEEKNGYLTFINYNIQDGLPFNQYNQGAMFKAPDGEMFFGGVNGFISFFPGRVNPTPPRTLISNFMIFNQVVEPGADSPLEKHISETDHITLSYDQNAFSFEFVALHYSQPFKNQYLYKMEGFDKEWLDGHRRYAPYTNLDPGQYTFRVKASNSDGIWNKEGTSLAITILPPWWRTSWAYTGYGIFFIGLIFGIDRLQRRKLLAKTRERMKIQNAEHRAEAAELEARVARAENERKTKELEEARELQLSMLPKELPQLPHLDIAVYMQTATEVGGDYYDFHVSLDGTLTVVIGDATGHGMKAGTMVTTAKSLFNSYAPNPDILFSFSEIARCIKQMNFAKMSMCMTMLKIKGDKLEMSTAGMPPSFIFRKDTQVIEEHLFKAMPLGTMDNFPYEIKDTKLNPGDTILLMSDGLPELKNSEGQMYGYKKIRNGFEDVAGQSPEEIISYLKNEGASWVNNEDPDDDVTFVVLKVK